MITDDQFYQWAADAYRHCIETLDDDSDWEQEFFNKMNDLVKSTNPHLRVAGYRYAHDCDDISDILFFMEDNIRMRAGTVISMTHLSIEDGYMVLILIKE